MLEIGSNTQVESFFEATTAEKISIPANDGEKVITSLLSERSSVVGTITMAFSTDPVARWMYPDPSEYLDSFPSFVRAFAGAAFESRGAYRTRDFSGAALWLPPGAHPNEDELIQLIWSSTSENVQQDLFPLLEQMDRSHPDGPHWYLPMIGVEGRSQGLGIGGALMGHALKRIDQENLPAYLESSNPRNIKLYERFGFSVTGKLQVGGSPPIFPMLRPPSKNLL